MKSMTAVLLLAQSLLLVAACAVSVPDQSASPTAASEAVQREAATPAYRPGIGVVDSASVASLPSASSGPSAATMAYRLRMDDGSTQNVVLAGERFELGDRVEVTSDGRLIRR